MRTEPTEREKAGLPSPTPTVSVGERCWGGEQVGIDSGAAWTRLGEAQVAWAGTSAAWIGVAAFGRT